MEPRAPETARRRDDWLGALVPVGAFLITCALRMLQLTTRRRFVNGERLFDHWARGEQVIIAFWHEQLVMMPFAYRGTRVCILVSRHRDGELIARAVEPLGVTSARGSSTRGWVGGLKEMLRAFRAGADLAFVPDGPRGPRYAAKSGAVQIARATGAPIFPIAAAARRAHRIGSWDRLILPYPGTTITYQAGEPIYVDRDAGPDEVEAVRAALERELTRLTSTTRGAVGLPAEPELEVRPSRREGGA